VARGAAPTIKRVHQELGGKSPHIVLECADMAAAVNAGVRAVMRNSGQSCNAPTRLLVPRSRMAEAVAHARKAAESLSVGLAEADMGPVVSQVQWEKIQGLIRQGIDEGALVVAGGLGKPEGLSTGYYVKPTVLAEVDNGMSVARDEIFGPVLVIIGYESMDEAVQIANDTPYGLAAYV